MHPFPHRYVVSSTATAEDDIVLTSPGIPSLTTVTPPEFDGPGGTLERPDRVTQFTRFDLRATVVLPPEVSEEQARRILTRAEETCLITRSLKGETHLHIAVEQMQHA